MRFSLTLFVCIYNVVNRGQGKLLIIGLRDKNKTWQHLNLKFCTTRNEYKEI